MLLQSSTDNFVAGLLQSKPTAHGVDEEQACINLPSTRLELILPVHNLNPGLRDLPDDRNLVNYHILLHDHLGSRYSDCPLLVVDFLDEHSLLNYLHLWELLDDFHPRLIFLGLQKLKQVTRTI